MKIPILVKFFLLLVILVSPFSVGISEVMAQIGVVIDYDGKVVRGEEYVAVSGNVYTLVSDVVGMVEIRRSNCIFDGNGYTISQGAHGIIFSEANVTIKNVVIKNCGYGISPGRSSLILNCTITNNVYGIVIGHYGMGNNIVSNNTIIENQKDGIVIKFPSNLIENNFIANNDGRGILLDGTHKHPANNSIINNVIKGNKQHGIEIVWTSPNTNFTQNLVAENAFNGITLYHTEKQNLCNNTIIKNGGHGVYIEASNLNVVQANTIGNNTGAGISLVAGSAGNSVSNNTLSKNSWLGIHLDSSSGNLIYHNFFSENGKVGDRQAVSLGSVNEWDNGYPSGGNLWSDYEGADIYQGPEQNQPGSDGIGDTPYIINSEKDKYPLINAIIIQPDGTVSPSNAPVDKVGDIYTLKEDIRTRIIVYRNHCVLDGNGYTISDVDGTAIFVEASEVTVTNFKITRCGIGISVYGGKDNRIIKNEITYCSEHGIVLTQTKSSMVNSNNVSFSYRNGILTDGAYNTTIASNGAASNLENGIYIINSTETHIGLNELLENRACGLALISSNNNSIGRSDILKIITGEVAAPNTITHNYLDGIYLERSSNNLITKNTISDNGHNGIFLSSSEHNGIGENKVDNNTLDGIALHRSSENVFGWNFIEGNRHAILLYESAHNRFDWTSIKLTKGDGIYIDGSSYNHIELAFLTNCTGNGIVLQGASSYNRLLKIYTEGAGGNGIFIHGSDNNEFLGVVSNASSGNGILMAAGSSNNQIIDNIIVNNTGNGIFLDRSSNNRISYSTIGNNSGIGICFWHSSDNQLIESKVENNAHDGIKLDFADHNVIEKNNVTRNKCGIVLVSESNANLLHSNEVIGNREHGFLLIDSSGNTLTKNRVATNPWQGIVLSSSSNNSLTLNTLESNGESGASLIQSFNNNVLLNIIANNSHGGLVLSQGSSNNAITNNTVTYNGYAIIVDASSGNMIYHNNFLNNTMPPLSVYSKNVWDNNYPSGGNYWSDYKGVDVYSGKNQSVTGSDGLGDSPYVIDVENVDHYPLVNSTGDVSITDLRVVQVVFDPPAIIAVKKAALYIEVFSSFVKNVAIEIKVTYGFGAQTYVERGKDNKGVIIEPGINRIYVPGGPIYPNSTSAWMEPDGGVFLYWNITGTDSGIKASLDPENKIREMNEQNNEMLISKKVIETKPLKVLVKSYYFPEAGQKPYVIDTQSSAKFLLETFPISENVFEWVQSQIVAMPGVPPEEVGAYEDWIYNHIALPQSIGAILAGYDRVVLVINNTDHDWGGLAIGMLREPDNQIPVFVDYRAFNATKGWMESTLVAHEIGHTFYLWHPHDVGPPVWRSICYCVSSRSYETEMCTFMSYCDPPNWIDPGRYWSDQKNIVTLASKKITYWNLLDQFKTVEDPEVIVISGILCRNQTVKYDYPWYYMKQGTIDSTLSQSGDYSIVMLDRQNSTLGTFRFNASFEYLMDVNGSLIKTTTNTVPFIFNLPYLVGTSRIEIRNATNAVLASRVVSAHSPTVTLTFPSGGETLPIGSVCTVKWQGSDSDGDKLTYTLMYSQDDGETWIPLALNVDGNSYLWDMGSLAKGSRYRVKVLATDGVNVGEDVSDRSFAISDQTQTNPPFWQEPWFIGAIIAFIAAALLITFLTKRRYTR